MPVRMLIITWKQSLWVSSKCLTSSLNISVNDARWVALPMPCQSEYNDPRRQPEAGIFVNGESFYESSSI